MTDAERQLALSRDRGLETETPNTLGETLNAMHQPQDALLWHRSALALAEQTGDRFEQARAREGIGLALHGTGDAADAAHHGQRAAALCGALEVPVAAARPVVARSGRSRR